MIPRVILDTDFSSDIDDCGDLVTCIGLHLLGHINLIGVVVSSSNPKAPGAVNAILMALGAGSVPIGALQGETRDPQGPGVFVAYVYDNYAHTVGLASTVTEATALYRTLLTDSPDQSVVIIATGGATCIEAARQALSSLIIAKVSELAWAVGGYPSMVEEFNVGFDIPAATAVMSNWPTPIVYSGYENGLTIIAGGVLSQLYPLTDIIRAAYAQWGVDGFGRESWGMQAVLWAAFRHNLFTLVRGSNAVVAGGNAFTASSSGRDAYTVKARPDSHYSGLLNALIAAPRGNPLVTWPNRGYTALLQGN